jgi:hypothetical protein
MRSGLTQLLRGLVSSKSSLASSSCQLRRDTPDAQAQFQTDCVVYQTFGRQVNSLANWIGCGSEEGTHLPPVKTTSNLHNILQRTIG